MRMNLKDLRKDLKMKLVILDYKGVNPGDLSFDDLRDLGDLVAYEECPDDDEEIIKRCEGADIVLLCYARMSRAVMEALPDLSYIGVLSTGYDSVDLEAARDNDIVVTNVPGYGSDAVAQHALALLLEVTNRVGHHDKEVKDGRWSKEGYWNFGDFPMIELRDKTVGIMGLGQIGLAAARIYRALNMDVIAYNRSKSKEGEELATYVSADHLFKKADIIDLHLPLTEDTKDIINKDSIGKMKDGAIIINTARGGLIDEKALIEGLESGKIFAAGLDVVKNEPIADDDPLLAYDNIIISPHMAWGPRETRARLMDIAYDNIRSFMDGGELNKVN